jgi:hypothetical protein
MMVKPRENATNNLNISTSFTYTGIERLSRRKLWLSSGVRERASIPLLRRAR